MICQRCGAANRVGRRFCAECGAPFGVTCPACGAANEPGEKFCGDCGSPLPDGPVTASAARPRTAAAPLPVAERRLVSVLFADLVGFTTIAEGRDSEEVRELLTRWFDVAADVVTRYGGTVEKFIGDAVMAVWGTPVAREDDAERAVRAALDLLDSVPGLGPDIAARAGVLTGEVTVSLGATNQGMVAGDLVNTAARLQSVAHSGWVLVGEATRHAASAAIVFEPVGQQHLRGKAAPVPAWRAVRVVAEVGGRNRTETLEAPFVGREDELRLLKDLFHATAREGRARLVSVTGIGGIGKSRLAWELEKYLDGIAGTVWWHRGRSPAYGSGLSFWALGEMVRARIGVTEDEPEAGTRAAIARGLDALGMTDTERRWVEPALLTLLGVETGAGPEQLFGAWRAFFERLAATGPVVMVFEDLHWADTGTLDFIDHLLEWSRSSPLYVITLARPELLDRRPDWGAGRRTFSAVSLEPLRTGPMRELLAGLVPGLPSDAIDAIVARAEGVPLYAVETVRMLLAQGRLAAAGDGTFRPAGDLATLAIPETLTALIAARLDALDPADRAIVLDASVLGQSFTPAALAAVSGLDEAALEPRLRSLVRRELLAHETDPRSPERGQYAFVQSLIREVAYHTLARRDRKARHLAAARHFESLGSDELAGAIAEHFLAARDLAGEGPEANALAAEARAALRGAAERAASLGGHAQAQAFLEQALGITQDPIERATVMARAGEEAYAAGRMHACERLLTAATATFRAAGDAIGELHTATALARSLNSEYRSDEARAIVEPVLAVHRDLAGDPAMIALRGQIARSIYLSGDLRGAYASIDEVLEAAEGAELRDVIPDMLVTKGTILATVGRVVEGMAVLAAGRELALAGGLWETVFRGTNNQMVTLAPEDPAASVALGREGVALARRLGSGAWLPTMAAGLAGSAWQTGEWEEARAAIAMLDTEEVEPAHRIAPLLMRLILAACLGEPTEPLLAETRAAVDGRTDAQLTESHRQILALVALIEGRTAEAWRLVGDDGRVWLDEHGRLGIAVHAAIWLRDPAAVLRVVEAFTRSRPRRRLVRLEAQLARAALAAHEGRTAEALAGFRATFDEWQEHGLHGPEVLGVIGLVATLGTDLPEVAEAAARGRRIMERLGAQGLLDRLGAFERSAAAVPPASPEAGA